MQQISTKFIALMAWCQIQEAISYTKMKIPKADFLCTNWLLLGQTKTYVFQYMY